MHSRPDSRYGSADRFLLRKCEGEFWREIRRSIWTDYEIKSRCSAKWSTEQSFRQKKWFRG